MWSAKTGVDPAAPTPQEGVRADDGRIHRR
jgi:hypothetical protein